MCWAGRWLPKAALWTAFSDGASVSSWAAGAVDWAVSQGLLTGKPGNLLDPQGGVSRAEAATLLARLLRG